MHNVVHPIIGNNYSNLCRPTSKFNLYGSSCTFTTHDLLRPCLIRPKPDLDFKIRILKPWGCKQTECWIRIRFLENKCKIWIYFLSRCHYLSILSERILSKCHCVVSLTFYCEIVDYEMIKQIVWSFHQTLAHRRPPSWIQWIWLRGWFHGFTNPDSVSENLA